MLESALNSTIPLRIFVSGNTSDAISRAALCCLLHTQPDFEVVGNSSHGDETVRLVSQLRPDIVLFDMDDFDETLQSLLLAVFKADTECRVVLLTSSRNYELLKQAIDHGVMGIVQQNQSVELFFKALRCVHAGEIWIERTMVTSLLHENKRPQSSNKDNLTWRISTLTKGEHDVISLVCQAMKNQAIAAQLFISEATVRHRLTAIFEKLQISGRVELVIFAHYHGLFERSPSDSLLLSSQNLSDIKRPRARK